MSHGGDIYSAAAELKRAQRKILDFSASINPLGISPKVSAQVRRHLKYLPAYPDTQCRRLRGLLSKRLAIPEKNILCGNGSTELIYLVVRALRPERVLVPAPVFSEYERAVVMYGPAAITHLVSNGQALGNWRFALDVEAFAQAMAQCDMAFLCNPNSPTGWICPRDHVLYLALRALETGCYLVVDEAFMDFLPQGSLAQKSVMREVVDNPRLIVLRSFTKFYALSGLRLGMMYFHEKLLDILTAAKEPWTVNSLAQSAGYAALLDTVYEKETFAYLKKEKKYFEQKLTQSGLAWYPSDLNFYLVQDDRTPHIVAGLRKAGILVRDCSDYRGLDERFFRVAVKSHRENSVLFKTLSRILGSHTG